MADEVLLNPSTKSSDYVEMIDYWDKVDALLGGTATMRAAGQAYLPTFPEESSELYNFRLSQSVLTNIYKDVVENLASKPFAKKVRFLEGKSSKEIQDLGEDIDGRGNNLHVFAADAFFHGINNGLEWILVDKMTIREGATVAEEKAAGARPYWVHVRAKDLFAVYTDMIDGKEAVVHARIRETKVSRDGWGEVIANRVRVLSREYDEASKKYGPATWELWEEKDTSTNSKETVWSKLDGGPIAIGVIALVPYLTGRRIGTSWIVDAPLKDAVDLQMDHYQQENGLKDAKTMTCYPMLVGEGLNRPVDQNGQNVRVPVGPRAVLFAPMDSNGRAGTWKFIEPGATSLQFLASDLKKKEDQIRELGRAPLTAQSVGLTVVTSTYASQKANSAVQAWTFGLKDAIEQALIFTSMFMGGSESPMVWIYTDFPTEAATEKAPDVIMKLREKKEISREAMFDELKRFNIVSPEYDPKADEEKIAEEAPDDPTLEDVEGALAEGDDPPGGVLTAEQKAELLEKRKLKVVA